MEFSYKNLFISAVCVAAVSGIGYAVYFDYKRRNDGNFRKELKKKKKAVKKEVEEEAKESQNSIAEASKKIDAMFKSIKQEPLPDSQEEREAYLFHHLNQGEILANRGPEYYEESAGHIFRAVVCCPNPLELVMLVEKMLPKGCYDVVLGLFSLEIKEKQAEFLEYYNEYPPSDMNVKLAEDPTQSVASSSDPIKKHDLVANKDFSKGQVIYTEKPIISVLHPGLEGKGFCSACLKVIEGDSKRNSSIKHSESVFCSESCLSASEDEYPKSISGKEKALDVFKDAAETHDMIPSLMSRILNRVFQEHEKTLNSKNKPKYTAMQHVERFIAAKLKTSESRLMKETELVQSYLRANTEGVEQVVTSEYYMGMKGKLVRGAFGIVSDPEHPDVVAVAKSNEGVRSVAPGPSTGCGIYVTSSYLRDGMFDANTQAEFRNKDNTLTLVATKDIKKGDILMVASFNSASSPASKSDKDIKSPEFPPLSTETEADKAPVVSELASEIKENPEVPSYAEVVAEDSEEPQVPSYANAVAEDSKKSDTPSYADIAADSPPEAPVDLEAPSKDDVATKSEETPLKSGAPSYAAIAADSPPEAPVDLEAPSKDDVATKSEETPLKTDAPSYADIAADAPPETPIKLDAPSDNDILAESQEDMITSNELSSSQEFEKVEPIEKDSEL